MKLIFGLLIACTLSLASCATSAKGAVHQTASPSRAGAAASASATAGTGSASGVAYAASGPAARLGPLAAVITLSRPAYKLTLISIHGTVVATAMATLPSNPAVSPCSQAGCDRTGLPFTSASDSRLYYLDGDSQVKALAPDGSVSDVTKIQLPPKSMVAFSVSPDDHRMAFSILDYSALPNGYMGVRVLVQDLPGGKPQEIFSSAGIVEWPIGWQNANLVLAVGAQFDGTSPNPYSASEYHVVDPATGRRIARIGQPGPGAGPGGVGALCNRGPVVAAGTACWKTLPGATELGIQDWNGYYRLLQRTTSSSPASYLALSPDGTMLAAQLTGNSDGPLVLMSPSDQQFAGAGLPQGWINNEQLVVRTGSHLAIREVSTGAITSLAFDGEMVGIIPGSLDAGGSPGSRFAPQFAYDAAHHEAVLFSGSSPNGDAGDTWTWDGRGWTARSIDYAPPPRHGGAFIYDPVRKVMLLFGGWTGSGFLDDTWTWDGSRWLKPLVEDHPSARGFSGIAFDTHRGAVILFGGWNGSDFFSDMWSWDGRSWSKLPAAASTPQLNQVGMSYRKGNGDLVVVGEKAQGTGIFEGLQTWTYDGHSWQAQGTGTPCWHHYGGAGQNLDNDSIVVYGGECTTLTETATFDGSRWLTVNSLPAPASRGQEAGRPGLTYDTDHHLMLLFGGAPRSGPPLGDLWAWDGAHWTRID